MNRRSKQSARRSDEIVRHVTGQLRSGEITVGDRLPSERDLAQQLGVSRPLIREGYRVLESLGVIEVRHGSGVYVADGTSYDGDTNPLWSQSVSLLDVVAVADVLTQRIGELAAVNITDEQVEQLRALYERQEAATAVFDLQALAEIDSAFHTQIAIASRNAIAIAFNDLVQPVLRRDRNILLGIAADQSLIEHFQIFDGIQARDPVRAGIASRHHLLRSHRIYRDIERSALERDQKGGDFPPGKR